MKKNTHHYNNLENAQHYEIPKAEPPVTQPPHQKIRARSHGTMTDTIREYEDTDDIDF